MAREQKMGIDERVESTMEAASQQPFFDGSVARMMSWPFEAWLRAQAEILKASGPVAAGWLERRRAAAASTLDTIERLAHCSDLKEAAAIQRGWLEESMKRLDSDFNAFADQALAISRETMSATRSAAQSSADVVALAIQPAQRAAERPPVDAAA
jgi:phasin protein